ncbi:RHS repeat-associated core domain-containing protein [Chryseobacterium sp. CT-SW4]|uniref:RHS repeat-associated core domain-containing protein n=1 Tax=Chryseobacterium sp. SW-1 TaxID=3157343 RepID=UPI003B018837
MKNFYSLFLSLLSVLGYSQTILYQQESSSRTVQDPQTVILAPGFKATSSVSNPFIAKIGPSNESAGGGPTDSQAGATNPSGTTAPSGQSFHDTKGEIEVNGAGQLQFTLPIALPPGVKSVAPQINLVYTSGSGNGIAGYGWNISGITAISRIGKNVENDDVAKGIQLDNSDYYSFNGQRLILKSGEYGKNGAEYITEKYSNLKIKSIGGISGQPWQGPEYWEVTFEDGSQAWYGGTTTGNSTARTPIEYNMVKWKDAQGNYITYNYSQLDNVAVVSSIKWGGNEKLGKSHFNEIQFSYLERSLAESSYINGIARIQRKILDYIVVKSNNNQFKKYRIDYFNNGTNYQFVSKITEFNSINEPANPVNFKYPERANSVVDEYTGNPDPFNNVKFTGDFNGDSYLDFVMNNGTVKLGAFNETFTNIITNKQFNNDAKVVSTLLDEEGQVYNGNGIVQYEDGYLCGYIFRNNSFVKVFNKLISNNYCEPGATCDTTVKFDHGDLNGDGIEDVFLTLDKKKCINSQCNNDVKNFIIDLKSNSRDSMYKVDPSINESLYTEQKYIDIDGDGKTEIIDVSNTKYTVFEFVEVSSYNYLKKIKFTGNLIENKDPEFPILFGDFNGDGKLDFTIPVTDYAIGKPDDWRFYIGTEKGFNNFLKKEFFTYRKYQKQMTNSYAKFAKQYSFAVTDMNKDGKSDVIQVFSYNQINLFNAAGSRDFGYVISTRLANGTASDGTLDFQSIPSLVSPTYGTQDIMDLTLFTPLTNPIKSNNNYYNVFIYWKQYLKKIKAPTSLEELGRISSVIQGGITTTVKYLEVIPNNTNNSNFYKKVKKEYYPYFSLNRVDNEYAVSQIQQEGRKQDFRYRGLTGKFQGKGIIGYHQTARSSWYTTGFENTKVWSGVEMDILNEGLPAKEWSIRTNDENKIFPTNISETNTQLLSFKSTIYQSDQLLNGQLITYIPDSDKSRVVKAIIPSLIKTKDFLTGTLTENSITYGEYYLPAKNVSKVNNNYAITTSKFIYTHNSSGIGANYFIGRAQTKTEVVQAYGDTKSLKEEYTYDNNNQLKTLKTWNRDNTGYLLETYNYDAFGNITQKIISNSIDSQTQTTGSQYDAKGRFVEKKTDNLGLETHIIYNDWGQVKKQIDPLGNTLENDYDPWGKLMKSKTNLGGTTTFQYERDAQANIIITQNNPNKETSKKYTNKLGQDYKTSSNAFVYGQYILKEVEYDILGRKIKESEPYFNGHLQPEKQWTNITYDDSVFPAKVTVTLFNGKKIQTFISGNITTEKELNGYGRTTSKTTDALGNIISSTDKGGTIKFSYNAVGEQIKAQYGTNIVTTKYDVWGRKSEFNDPSNGLYKYEYDGFGHPKKITSPKGTKEYDYNNLGQLISQKELSTTDGGHATDKSISFSYDNKGRIISKYGFSKGQPYSSNIAYDPQGRVLSSSESSNGKYFIQKGLTYDDKARVISYEKQLYSSGVLTKVQIENVYSPWGGGQLYLVKDKTTGKILWQLKSINARRQVLTAKLGAAEIKNSYDSNGFLNNVNHSSSVKPSILQQAYSFDAIKNELKLKITGGDFNIVESFDYDDNNRLVNWTNPVTGVKPTSNRNVYDAKGRITQNDQVGTIQFGNSAKVYQPTGMTLNAAGTQNYNNDLIQSIAYNENNDPVYINGQKGDVAFQYGLTSMRQRVTYGGNFDPDQDGKFTKFYSQDGSFEVVRDNTTGKEKHVLYIGGSPYESNIVYLKNYTESSGSYKFLHKDYIGSILAISDEAGNKLEQRHFDAWGNFTHLQIGNESVITDKNVIDNTSLLIERGYTSHEHFAEVGIIHMNGRLYDPLLRRFLNADENIQDPYNTQNYNKYGYVLNNPLMFNDPSGEFIPFATIIAVVAKAAFSAVAISAATYTVTALINGNFSVNGFFKSMSQAAIMGILSGGLSFGIGSVFAIAGVTNTLGPIGTIIGRASAHAISMGVISTVMGGGFANGALSGAFSSLSGDFLQGARGFWGTNAGKLVSGIAAGGVGSVLGGGNFWMGAMNGFFVTAFNHLEHITKTSFKVYDSDGEYVGKIKVKEYETYISNDGSKGIKVEVIFNSETSKYSNYEWVQTIFTNAPIGGGNNYSVYNDPQPGDDNSPYYYTKQDYKDAPHLKNGNQYTFIDAPRRELRNFNVGWRAELSLVGINNTGAHALHTFWYGFNLYPSNHIIAMPIYNIQYKNRYQWLKK